MPATGLENYSNSKNRCWNLVKICFKYKNLCFNCKGYGGERISGHKEFVWSEKKECVMLFRCENLHDLRIKSINSYWKNNFSINFKSILKGFGEFRVFC